MKQLHQKQGRKPIHTIPITTGKGKTAALTHLCTLSEFTTSNLIRKLKVYYKEDLGSLNVLIVLCAKFLTIG